MTQPLVISDATIDFQQFVTQFQDILETKGTWKGTLTTQTSTALIQLAATIGTFNSAQLIRYFEDSFPDTVQSDGAIRAIAVMQGIRLSRKLPATVQVLLSSPSAVSIAPYTQFNIGGMLFFNNAQVAVDANTQVQLDLYEGEVKASQLSGLGTNLQAFLSNEDSFSVSDQDVVVLLNQAILPKAFGGLWNYLNQPAYSDLTHSDGRLIIQFGSGKYGAIPGVNDVVTVVYVLTQGGNGNSLVTVNKRVIAAGLPTLSGICNNNPIGGADEKSTVAYKNVESGAFGTYSSAVTKNQYKAIVNTYPGIVDAVTQSQREINPRALQWMNVIRVSALTSSPWTDVQKQAFCKYAQDVTMYSPYFIWQDPTPVAWDVSLTVFCYNTAIPSVIEAKVREAIQAMFAFQPGLLMTNFYESDLISAALNSAPGEISYVTVSTPAGGEMIVTAPESPQATAVVTPGGGTLKPMLYAYSISVVKANGEEGPPVNWVFPQVYSGSAASITLLWPANKSAAQYKIYGRQAGQIGLLATVNAAQLSWTDSGSTLPTGNPPNQLSDLPVRYNALRTLDVSVKFSTRQHRVNLG